MENLMFEEESNSQKLLHREVSTSKKSKREAKVKEFREYLTDKGVVLSFVKSIVT